MAMVLRNLGSSVANPGELRFWVRTSNAVAGVRGTCFFIKVEDDNNTFVCCCNGAFGSRGRAARSRRTWQRHTTRSCG